MDLRPQVVNNLMKEIRISKWLHIWIDDNLSFVVDLGKLVWLKYIPV